MNFSITLPEEALNLIGDVLSDRPYKEVAGLIKLIGRQVNEQRAAAAQDEAQPSDIPPAAPADIPPADIPPAG